MEKQTIFIKRFPSKRELPKESGEYNTSIGNVCFENVHNKFFNHKGELTLVPEWYLEEIELPSEEEVDSKIPYKSESPFHNATSQGFKLGVNFILNKLKGV